MIRFTNKNKMAKSNKNTTPKARKVTGPKEVSTNIDPLLQREEDEVKVIDVAKRRIERLGISPNVSPDELAFVGLSMAIEKIEVLEEQVKGLNITVRRISRNMR